MSGGGGDEEGVLTGCEVLALRVEMRLVPRWSNVVERIARHHGERVEMFVDGGEMVVRVAVKPENKPGLIRDVDRYWSDFAVQQKADGSWQA